MSAQHTPEQVAFRKGAAAFRRGVAEEANPFLYPDGLEGRRQQWFKGWAVEKQRSLHKLETSRSGAQSGYATGRCKCGWSYSGWTDRATDVRASFTRHVEAAIAKAVEGAQS